MPTYEAITIRHNPSPTGVYDPSIAYDQIESQILVDQQRTGWMVCAGLANPLWDPHPNIDSTFLAKTVDGGETWTYAGVINEAVQATETVSGVPTAGMWKYETPCLVYDASAHRSKRWKLFSHKLFWSNTTENNVAALGYIAYRYASNPTSHWSNEVLLFQGIAPLSPYNTALFKLNQLTNVLADAVTFSEPGALVVDGVLYVSLTVVKATGPNRVILISSSDQGDSWNYHGVLVDRTDAQNMGYVYFDGSSLAQVGENIYLLTSPATASVAHNGTHVYSITDLSTATIARDGNGHPDLVQWIEPDATFLSSAGAGQATYDPGNTYGGVILPQINLNESPAFLKLYNTLIQLD